MWSQIKKVIGNNRSASKKGKILRFAQNFTIEKKPSQFLEKALSNV